MTFRGQLWALYGIEVFLLGLWLVWRRKALTEQGRKTPAARRALRAHWVGAGVAALTLIPMLTMAPDSDWHRSLLTFSNIPLLAVSMLCVALYVRTRPVNRPAAPPLELELVPDRLPRTVWLAMVPPAAIAGFLVWLSNHAEYQPVEFRSLRIWLVLPCMLGISAVVRGVAEWYGTARTVASRVRFDFMVSHSLTAALLLPAVILPTQFGWKVAPYCFTSLLAGLGITFVVSRRLRRIAPEPEEFRGWYCDWEDPAMWGPRGTNLGNPWQWALWVVEIAPIFIPFWLI